MLPHSVRATFQEGEPIFDQAAADEQLVQNGLYPV